jgi:hypothetical protein
MICVYFVKKLFLTGYRDSPGIPIDRDMLSTAQTPGRHSSPQNSRNMILAGHYRTMAEWTAHIGNYPRGKGKEWRPGGCRDPCHQDITLSHLIKLIRAVNYPRQASNLTGAGSDSFQHIALRLIAASWHHTGEVYPQEAGAAFPCSILRPLATELIQR